MRTHLLLPFVASTALASAQGAAVVQPTTPPAFPAWPQDWSVARYAPVLDAQGQPVPRAVRAAGTCDFDRDGNRDLWFVAEDGAGATRLHTLLAHTADLGRFWPWADYPPGSVCDAATYRTTAGFDMVLGVDPRSDRLAHHFFVPNMSAPDPRLQGFWGNNPGWPCGKGCYEIEARDDDGDGHDDLLLLRSPDEGGAFTQVVFVAMAAPFGGMPWPQDEVAFLLPGRPERLRALDFDGDRNTDAALFLPGAGVAVLRNAGKQFHVAAVLPIPAGVRDLCVGDADGDGRDDLGVVLDGGVLLLHAAAPPVALAAPPGVGPLVSARILDFDRDGIPDVVASLATGDGVLVHQRGPHGFRAPLVHRPEQGTPSGPGALGETMLAFDADADGDLDLALQVRDGSFVTLRSGHRSLAPVVATVAHEGRFSESYISERIDLALPQAWRAAGIDRLEVGIYMRHPTQPGRPWVLWAHAMVPMPPNQPPFASVRLLYLVDLSKLPLLTSPYLYPQGFAVSGDTLLTLHGVAGARQRFESMLVFHEGRGDENKSTLGVQWKVIAAPPLPRVDRQPLPF